MEISDGEGFGIFADVNTKARGPSRHRGSNHFAHRVCYGIGRAGGRRRKRPELDVETGLDDGGDRRVDVRTGCILDEGFDEELGNDGLFRLRHDRQQYIHPTAAFTICTNCYPDPVPTDTNDLATSGLRIDIARLAARLADLADIGRIEGTEGSCRLALTDEDRAGRDLVVTWMRDLGLAVSIDGIGNIVAQTPGEGAPVMCGSHIDTVRTGGRYDGNLGVLAGLEVIETIQASGVQLDRPLAVGIFTDEEGARFAPDMLGSLVYVGDLPLEEALDIVAIDGAVLGDELDRIGYGGTAPVPGQVPHAYVELHIEQGPVLEVEGVTIGAVEGVQGISWTEVTVAGQSNHAGTTPIALRKDPGYVAAACATFVRELALELGHPQVGTVGRIEFKPNLVNVVPASATFTVDLRNTDEATLVEAERRFGEFLRRTADDEGCQVTTTPLARFAPVTFDDRVIALVEGTASNLGYSVRRMPSGAGHDAQMLARVCPTAMVFTNSVNGLSHNPAEYTAPGDLQAGANVLLHTMLALTTMSFADAGR